MYRAKVKSIVQRETDILQTNSFLKRRFEEENACSTTLFPVQRLDPRTTRPRSQIYNNHILVTTTIDLRHVVYVYSTRNRVAVRRRHCHGFNTTGIYDSTTSTSQSASDSDSAKRVKTFKKSRKFANTKDGYCSWVVVDDEGTDLLASQTRTINFQTRNQCTTSINKTTRSDSSNSRALTRFAYARSKLDYKTLPRVVEKDV